jgi:hypothetical protein
MQHWWQDAQLVGDSAGSTVTNLAMNLFTNKSTLLPWIQLFNCDRTWNGKDLPIRIAEVASPLY